MPRSALVVVLGLTQIVAAAAQADEHESARTVALLEEVQQGDDCTPEHRRFNDTIMRHGRIAAVSRAFEQCVDEAARRSYRKCQGDPFYDSEIGTQIARAVQIARSPNRVSIACTGGEGANAMAGFGNWGHQKDEALAWGGWFGGVHEQLNRRRICSGSERDDPDANGCRWGGYPWPYSQAAGIVWHEVAHTHGYTHGADSQEAAIQACGYAGDSSWNYQTNTMPYIIGDCIHTLLERSGAACAPMADCPGERQLRIVDGYGATSCSCISDPQGRVLGILGFKDGRLADRALLAQGEWLGGWQHGEGDDVRAVGDLDGDGRDEIALTSAWGLGVLAYDGRWWQPVLAVPNGTAFGDWVFDSRNNRIHDAGDLDGDGREELVVTSRWGLGLIGTDADGRRRGLGAWENGTAFGGWVFDSRNNEIRGVGNFHGDTRDEILVTSGWGVGAIGLSRSGMPRDAASFQSGTQFPHPGGGHWSLNPRSNRIHALADFDGDGRRDLLVTSDWGMGIISIQGRRSLAVHPNDDWLGDWRLATRANRVLGTGDVHGRSGAEIVLASRWGLGLVGLDGGRLTSIARVEDGTRFPGGWRLDSAADTMPVIADLNGDGRAEMLVTSRWGVGLLDYVGDGFRTIDLKPYDGLFGAWALEEGDRFSHALRLPGDPSEAFVISGQ